MKTIQEVISSINEYRVPMHDLFTSRFVFFLTEEQGNQIGLELNEGCVWPEPEPFTEEAIKEVVRVGVTKLYKIKDDCNYLEMLISNSTILSFLHILEDYSFDDEDLTNPNLAESIAKKYGIDLAE